MSNIQTEQIRFRNIYVYTCNYMSGVAISGKEMHESEKELTGIYVCIWITQREEMWDDP